MKLLLVRMRGPLVFGPMLVLTALSTAVAQHGRTDSLVAASVDTMLVRYRDSLGDTSRLVFPPMFRSTADSLDWHRWRNVARAAGGFRVVISISDRELQVLRLNDTLLAAPIAVASGITLDYAGRKWTFRTPRGQRPVLRKVVNPVWSPPDWLYAEVASEYGLRLAQLDATSSVALSDGRRLTVRHGVAGVVTGSRGFVPLPVDEHIIFSSTLYIPPFGTMNRRVPGELGAFALDLGGGYLIHGTPDETSIGKAVTHGCIRLADVDIAWLYERVPVGTPVYIY